MRGAKQVAGAVILVAVVFWFSLAVTTVWASGGESNAAVENAGHAAVGTAQAATGTEVAEGHGTDASASYGSNSLSAAKLKDLMWRVINFIALMIILVKFGAKPIAAALTGRQKQIKQEVEDLEIRRAEAEKSYRDFESKLAGMEKEIDGIVEKAIAQAKVEKVKIIEKAEQAANDIKRQAEMTVQNEIMVARRTLKNEIADQAAAMAEGLIKKNLTADDQVKIIEDYLEKVEAVQ